MCMGVEVSVCVFPETGLGCAGLTSGDVRWDVMWWDVMWCGEVRCGGM